MKSNIIAPPAEGKGGKKTSALKNDAKNKKTQSKNALLPTESDDPADKLSEAIVYLDNIKFSLDKELQAQTAGKCEPYNDEIQTALMLIGKYDPDKERAEKARKVMVTSNSRLVHNLLKPRKLQPNDYNDLFQEGFLGLMEAFDNYKFGKNAKFCTYATIIARSRISKYNRENLNGFLKVTDHVGRDTERMKRFVSDYLARYGIEPNISDIAKGLGISEEEVKYLHRNIRAAKYESFESNDATGYSDYKDSSSKKGVGLAEMIPADEEAYNVEDIAIERAMQSDVQRVLNTLDDTDRELLSDKFGIGTKEKSSSEMAKLYNTSKTTVVFNTCAAINNSLENTEVWKLVDYIV